MRRFQLQLLGSLLLALALLSAACEDDEGESSGAEGTATAISCSNATQTAISCQVPEFQLGSPGVGTGTVGR